MKSFKGYLTEFAQQSTSDYVFNTGSDSSALKIPISGPMFKRIWPDTIRTTVFHATDLKGLANLKKLEGGKKSISAFFSMMSRYMETGVATEGGGIVAEMDADVLISARDDIMSEVDKQGRRWVMMSWFEYQTRERAKFSKIEKDLNTLIANLVKKHIPKDKEIQQTKNFGKDAGAVFEIWGNMKRHLKGDGKAISLVIKDYFDGVEKIIKKNKEVMGDIFYGYTKSKRMTDNSWDEQIVNNIDIYKIHVIKPHPSSDAWGPDEIKQHITDVHKWPMKVWDVAIDLEIYTREVVNAEIRTMGGWSKK
jgi:hypothetical protein